jgi:DNA-binding beta-propeller fold protein YncE
MRKFRRFGVALVVSGIAVLALMPATSKAQDQPVNKPDTGPRLDFPGGLATDGVAIYVANSRNNTVDKIDLTSHSIQLVAGQLFKEGSNDGVGPTAMFASPSGVAIIGNDLYVSDTNNSTIRKVSISGGTVTTVAGATNISGTDDGKGSAAHFNTPTQIAADPSGSKLFVTDSGNSTIRLIQVPDMVVKTIAGQAQTTGKADGPTAKSLFNRPRGIATDGKVAYISDTGNDIIRKLDLSSMTTTTIAGTGEEGDKNGAGNEAQFNNPGAMATDGTTLYVLDADNHAVRKINLATNEVGTLTLVNGHIGSGCTLSKDGKTLYFSDTTENSIEQVDTSSGNVSPVFPMQ